MDIRKELKSLQTTESNIEALEECAEEYDKIFGAGNAISENCRQQRINRMITAEKDRVLPYPFYVVIQLGLVSPKQNNLMHCHQIVTISKNWIYEKCQRIKKS